MPAVEILPLAPESGDFVSAAVHAHLNHAETCADRSGLAEELQHLLGSGARCNVDILGLSSHEKIPHPAPGKERLVAMEAQFFHDPLRCSLHGDTVRKGLRRGGGSAQLVQVLVPVILREHFPAQLAVLREVLSVAKLVVTQGHPEEKLVVVSKVLRQFYGLLTFDNRVPVTAQFVLVRGEVAPQLSLFQMVLCSPS